MKLHILKIKYEYLIDVEFGRKTFELRKNDRDYQVGDLIHFVDVNGHEKKNNTYNVYIIDYILKDVPEYGLDKDYCILGIRSLNKQYQF